VDRGSIDNKGKEEEGCAARGWNSFASDATQTFFIAIVPQVTQARIVLVISRFQSIVPQPRLDEHWLISSCQYPRCFSLASVATKPDVPLLSWFSFPLLFDENSDDSNRRDDYHCHFWDDYD